MCRSIKTLRRPDQPATNEEIAAAALQFVRKVSGYRAPSRKNAEAFDAAVADIAEASRRLLEAITAVEPALAHELAHAHDVGHGHTHEPGHTHDPVHAHAR